VNILSKVCSERETNIIYQSAGIMERDLYIHFLRMGKMQTIQNADRKTENRKT
jgi:hypothetical protein